MEQTVYYTWENDPLLLSENKESDWASLKTICKYMNGNYELVYQKIKDFIGDELKIAFHLENGLLKPIVVIPFRYIFAVVVDIKTNDEDSKLFRKFCLEFILKNIGEIKKVNLL